MNHDNANCVDYIKREDAINVFDWGMPDADVKCGIAIQNIKDIPSSDVVEVVRCKDCKYHAEFSSKCNKLNLTPMWPNDYCSYGERKDEEDTDESVIAEWICLGHRMGPLKHPYSVDYRCSNCGHEEYTLLSPPPERCPNCRAHMKGEEDGM